MLKAQLGAMPKGQWLSTLAKEMINGIVVDERQTLAWGMRVVDGWLDPPMWVVA